MRLGMVAIVVSSSLALASAGQASAEPAAGPIGRFAVYPQLSYSVAVGKSGDALMGHMWAGVGAYLDVGPHRGLFVLGGVEVDFRDGDPDGATESALAVKPAGAVDRAPADPGGAEAWLALRAGQGWFKPRALAPLVSFYAIVGARLAGPDVAPRTRLGIGASIPAALPLAQLGIPTMIEAGIDGHGEPNVLRGFVRLGWNF